MLLYYFASAVKSVQLHVSYLYNLFQNLTYYFKVDDDIIDKLNYYYTTSIIIGKFFCVKVI